MIKYFKIEFNCYTVWIKEKVHIVIQVLLHWEINNSLHKKRFPLSRIWCVWSYRLLWSNAQILFRKINCSIKHQVCVGTAYVQAQMKWTFILFQSHNVILNNALLCMAWIEFPDTYVIHVFIFYFYPKGVTSWRRMGCWF